MALAGCSEAKKTVADYLANAPAIKSNDSIAIASDTSQNLPPLNQTIYKCPRKDLGFSTGLVM